MSLSGKGNGDDSEGAETMNIENANLDNSLSSLSSNDIQNLSELSQELTLTTDMETEEQEIVVENQEIVGHEEEVEMEEVVTEDTDVILDTSNKSDDQIFDTRANKTTVVPPLRPLTIAPKPTKMPLTVKSVGGQPLLLLQESCSSSTRGSPREIEEPCQTTPPLEPVVLSDTLQIPQNVEVNKKIVELLGENPINQNKKGKALHEELVVRWSNYLTEGIPVETRKELILKYPASENCAPLQAPKMNDEIKSILSAQAMKNDTFFTNLQTQLGAGLTIIGSILTEKLSTTSNDADNELVQKLSDASQLFASVHHAVSVKRKWESVYLVECQCGETFSFEKYQYHFCLESEAQPISQPCSLSPQGDSNCESPNIFNGSGASQIPGTGANQAIKLVAPQGQEINLANLISRPLTLKPTFKSISSPGGNISLVQQKPVLMKKVLTTSQKTVTKPLTAVTKPTQHFMVVQKADQQQINVLGMQTPTKTLTLQQAQEMGLLTNAKISQPGQSTGKQTVLLAKNPQKSIKLIPQVSSHQIITTGVGTKTVTLNQLKVPAKILPAGTNATNKTTQRIIFKTATGNQTILPQAQLLQVSAAQGLNTGQLHQINIPGRGMQYIKFVTANTSDVNTTTTTGTTIKTTPIVTPTNIVLSEVKPVSSLNRIIPKIHPKDKLPISPLSKPLTTTPLMVIPAHIPVTQQVPVSKVTIPPAAPPPKNAPTLKLPTGSEDTSPVPVKEEVDANGMRPRKPCNCNKSQCLKLYCDCFANGEFCYMCNCMNCFNNLENEEHRNRAIKACLERNPNAFRPKIGKAKDVAGDISIRKHTKGCNCKRSGCLKNYCECYEAKIACSNNCKCIGCRNIEDSVEKKNIRLVNEKSTNTPVYTETLIINNKNICQIRPRRSSSSRKQTINFITDDVIEATCQCLLTISDNADENVQDEEMTKHLIIEEFGRCLTEIIECSSNRSLS